MKRIAIYTAIFGIFLMLLQGCSLIQDKQNVAEFGTSKISLSEFENAYIKNSSQNKPGVDSSKQYENFLDLYLKFKMKLADAQFRGFDTNADLNNELIDYRKKVGVTYILEKQLVEPNLRRLWDMRRYEIRLSHLMIRPDSTGEDAALAKAKAILDTIKSGKRTFEEMVQLYTQDNYSKLNDGDIYYFTAGTFLPEFEEAFYKTPVGQINPEVIKTRYGFHILKVTEKIERVPEIHAAHILVDFLNEKGETDSVAARLRADSVYNMVTTGNKNFAATAKLYSKDQGSKDIGGDLKFFARRMMVKEFDEAAFKLSPNEISKPVKTQYGYHIIKLIERKPFPSFDEDKEAIKSNYKQFRYQNDYDTLTIGLRKKYGYLADQKVYNETTSKLDTFRLNAETLKSAQFTEVGSKVLYSMGGKSYSVDTLLAYAYLQSEFPARLIDQKMLMEVVKKHSGDASLEFDAMNLGKSNPEFASLMEDYKNGIFIFKLQEETIWNKLAVDSVKLVDYFAKNKANFTWPDRVEFSEIFVRTDSLLKICQEQLKSGVGFDSVAGQYTERVGMKEKLGRYELQDVNSSDVTRAAATLTKPGEVSPVVPNSGGFSLYQLVRKESARVKTFEEGRAEVSGAFQEEESKRLENEYIKALTERYKPVTYFDVLAKAFKK